MNIFLVEPKELVLKVKDLEFIHVQPHNSKKAITYEYDIVATCALYKRNIAIKICLTSVAQSVEQRPGNLATLVRVQVEANLFYHFNIVYRTTCTHLKKIFYQF